MHPRHTKHCATWSESSSCPVAHQGTCRRREVCPEKASQFLQSTASSRNASSEETERLRVFISGTTQLATVETKTSRTAMRASSTLMSLPTRVRAVAFSRPSSWTTCCCCSSILETRVWHASRASWHTHTHTHTHTRQVSLTLTLWPHWQKSRNSSPPKKCDENALPSGHQRSWWVRFFIRFVEMSPQWMLCSEWVLSEWEPDKSITIIHSPSANIRSWNKSSIKTFLTKIRVHNSFSSSDKVHLLSSLLSKYRHILV